MGSDRREEMPRTNGLIRSHVNTCLVLPVYSPPNSAKPQGYDTWTSAIHIPPYSALRSGEEAESAISFVHTDMQDKC